MGIELVEQTFIEGQKTLQTKIEKSMTEQTESEQKGNGKMSRRQFLIDLAGVAAAVGLGGAFWLANKNGLKVAGGPDASVRGDSGGTSQPTEESTKQPTDQPTKEKPTQKPTKAPTEAPTETQAVQKMHEFALTDGETLEMPEFATPQDAIDFLSQKAQWKTGDSVTAENVFFQKNDPDTLDYISKLKMIPSSKFRKMYALPRSGKNFFVIQEVELSNNGMIVLYETKEGTHRGINIDVQEKTFANFMDRGAYFLTTPTP